MLRVVSNKRRYRCSDCQWTGWRNPLMRQSGADLADQMLDAHEVRRKEVWYFVVVAVVFVLFLGTVLKQCADEAPIPPDDIAAPSARNP